MMAASVCTVQRDCSGIHQSGIDLSATLARGEIVIVDADLNRPVETIDGPEYLSEVEQCRALEYVQISDRIRFVRRRIVLRRLLGTILGRDPRSIVIRTNPSGKPFIAPDGRSGPLSFSLSHSRDRAIYAFAKQRQVGIDLEYQDPAIDVLKMAGVICTPAERARLEALPIGDRLGAFYDCWCTKEAFIKAAGVCEPTSFEILFRPQEPGLVRVNGEPAQAGRWSFHRLEVGSDWSASLVVEGETDAIDWHQDEVPGSLSQ